MIKRAALFASVSMCVVMGGAAAAEPARGPTTTFDALDVFALERAASPAIAPDGSRIAYVRVSGDVMTDRFRRSIWIVEANGSGHRPLAQGQGSYGAPVWSPDGGRLAFTATENGRTELRVFYLDTLREAALARLPAGAQNLAWSPDGATLAFQMFVKEEGASAAKLPPKPEGAQWGKSAQVIEDVVYRADGEGFLEPGFTQVFTLPADGGTPRQRTFAKANHDGRMSWSPDGAQLFFSANTADDWRFDPVESDIHRLDLATGAIVRLTSANGPEDQPILSPDGRQLAFVGFEDRQQGYQVAKLSVAAADGTNAREITADLDRDVAGPVWSKDGKRILFLIEDAGDTKLMSVEVASGKRRMLAGGLGGGGDFGRPYTGGAFSVADTGAVALTTASPTRPADLTLLPPPGRRGAPVDRSQCRPLRRQNFARRQVDQGRLQR